MLAWLWNTLLNAGVRQYPAIAPSWERNWERLTPYFDYPPEIRKVVYTTNAIESLNYSLRKVIKGRGAFPHDDAIKKLLYLGIRNVAKKMDQADTGLESGAEPVHYSLW
jgi:transposase-like protein